jgi:hypothetical protein
LRSVQETRNHPQGTTVQQRCNDLVSGSREPVRKPDASQALRIAVFFPRYEITYSIRVAVCRIAEAGAAGALRRVAAVAARVHGDGAAGIRADGAAAVYGVVRAHHAGAFAGAGALPCRHKCRRAGAKPRAVSAGAGRQHG